MDGRRESLRECIERHASSAQREALTRGNSGENDDDNDNRSMTVGDAIEGAATTTTDSARLAAAPVFNQPTHNTRLPAAQVSDICPRASGACTGTDVGVKPGP